MNETLALDQASEYLKVSPNAMYELALSGEVAAKALEDAANTGDWWQGRGLRGDEIRVGLRKMATERRNRK